MLDNALPGVEELVENLDNTKLITKEEISI